MEYYLAIKTTKALTQQVMEDTSNLIVNKRNHKDHIRYESIYMNYTEKAI